MATRRVVVFFNFSFLGSVNFKDNKFLIPVQRVKVNRVRLTPELGRVHSEWKSIWKKEGSDGRVREEAEGYGGE